MFVPLWIPWTVTGALLLTTFAAFLGDSSLPHSRPPRWVQRMLWVPGIVALVASGVVTIDRLHVSQKELDTAARMADAELDGSTDGIQGDRYALAVQQHLGHDASAVSYTPSKTNDDAGSAEQYEVRPVSQRNNDLGAKGTVVCVTITQSQAGAAADLQFEDGLCTG